MYTKPIDLNQKLGTVHGHREGVADLFGIEVELEGRNIVNGNDEIFKHWTQHQDGSLRARNGGESIEYVLAKPLDLATTTLAVKNLFAYLNKKPAEVFESYRTSIHVHINCLEETQRTICNFITISAILDELLVSQNGQHRIGNNFCLRTKDAEGLLTGVIKSVETYGQIYQLPREERYSSMNLASLMKFGTIEYRSLECTTDEDRLNHWVQTLQKMKIAARGFDNPKDVISLFSQRGPEDFLHHILGAYAAKYARVPDFDVMLQRGMRLAQDFAYCATWVSFKPGEEPQKRGYGAKAAGVEGGVMGYAQRVNQMRREGLNEEEIILRLQRQAAEGENPYQGIPIPRQPMHHLRGRDRLQDDLQRIVDDQHAAGRRRNIPPQFRHRYHIQDGRVVRKPDAEAAVAPANPFLNPFR